jgi:hypothetical protein
MSLKEICVESIALSIMNAPPMIQEIIIDSTKKHIEKKVTDEVVTTIEQSIPWMIDHILDDMIDSKIANRNYSVNYYVMFNHIDKRIVSTAIKSAKIMFQKMQNIQVNVPAGMGMNNMIGMVDMYDERSDDDEYNYDSNRYEDDGDDGEDEDDDKSFVSMRSM